jgi:hypothetical protein
MDIGMCNCGNENERPKHHATGCRVWEKYVADVDAAPTPAPTPPAGGEPSTRVDIERAWFTLNAMMLETYGKFCASCLNGPGCGGCYICRWFAVVAERKAMQQQREVNAAALEAKEARVRELWSALSFYGNPDNWDRVHSTDPEVCNSTHCYCSACPAMDDEGDRARDALGAEVLPPPPAKTQEKPNGA